VRKTLKKLQNGIRLANKYVLVVSQKRFFERICTFRKTLYIVIYNTVAAANATATNAAAAAIE
jgi:hypothetical protein